MDPNWGGRGARGAVAAAAVADHAGASRRSVLIRPHMPMSGCCSWPRTLGVPGASQYAAADFEQFPGGRMVVGRGESWNESGAGAGARIP